MLLESLSAGMFRLCHGSQLVYNTCWEDPRLDRLALELGPQDTVLVITSGGCNALDYLLDEPRHVYAVDVNWRQNALLELKLAAIRELDYETCFELFGRGRLKTWDDVYPARLRPHLSDRVREYWDNRGWMFRDSWRRGSFYFRGSAGFFAWLINLYVDRVARFRGDLDEFLSMTNLHEQREFYWSRIKPQLWGPLVRWITQRDLALAMLGVPRSQRRQIDSQYPGGIAQYIEDQIDELFTQISIRENYFWRVYATGMYSKTCCPEYLKREHFERLQAGLVDRITIHTSTILNFLEHTEERISRFVLLDHMDWLYEKHHVILRDQWQAIVDKAAPRARIIWRSAALEVDFVDPLLVEHQHGQVNVGSLLEYNQRLASQLHAQDRVHTYGSFYIADLRGISDGPTSPTHQQETTDDECRWDTQDAISTKLLADSR